MKLFAPRNDWNPKSPAESNWWNMIGGYFTPAGVNVSEDSALKYSAVSCATRIISETMASLPIGVLKQVDSRTTERATDHPLWPLLHVNPNPEQDAFGWIDMQTAFLCNWGNCFAEIQRDAVGKIIGLWPIHPSRIPAKQIRRNPRVGMPGWEDVYVGGEGEIVYYVTNDDHTFMAIPKSDMLHVHGVLSQDGILGMSMIRLAATNIGIAMATEQHAGAFFRNGAATNLAIKSPKIVGKETAERLRDQWAKTFGGVGNHYKTLLLEDGMEPVPISLNPEDSQLLESRKLPVEEIARVYRIPPYMMGMLEKSSYASIEAQSLSFLQYTMLPWIRRWEMALQQQLLRPNELGDIQIKFNERGLLRGDMSARSAYYKARFDMGSLSPNEIREKEDENPIEGGDQYFVPANNLVPLDMIEEYIDSQMNPPQPTVSPVQSGDANQDEPSASEPPATNHAAITAANLTLQTARDAVRHGITATVENLMKTEQRAAKRAAGKPETFLKWRDEFYDDFADKFATAIAPFAPAATLCGVALNPLASAHCYVRESVAAFDSLVELRLSEFEPAVHGAVDAWSQRPAKFTDSIFDQGA